jgi:hypothetical protein
MFFTHAGTIDNQAAYKKTETDIGSVPQLLDYESACLAIGVFLYQAIYQQLFQDHWNKFHTPNTPSSDRWHQKSLINQ